RSEFPNDMKRKISQRVRKSLFGALLAISLLATRQPLRAAEMSASDYQEFGKLAVQDNGRRKPIDTFAHESMMRVTGKSDFQTSDGHTWTPNEWMLSMLLETHDWKNEPMILVAHRPLAEKLGLDPSTKRYSLETLAKLPELETLAKAVHARRGNDEKP